MVNIVLVEPEIPQNCGNIARTCAATRCRLHLVEPLGFDTQDYSQARFSDGCWLFFGKETAGLPEAFRLAHARRCIRIPMRGDARSLNLANSVAVLAYEALRQQGFPGLSGTGEMAAGSAQPW
ncbi:MAG: tRNA (cytidine(34)-2'-O)-methyltransferase [Oscillospiraceae bacterium]|nr:tRNA (cytidine(34)-2'-O)-methyltransferase [Oscillospiraceae bacterium]